MAHQVAGDRIFAALAESYESILAEVTAHQSADEYCPFCGSPLDHDQSLSSDIVLKATLPEHIASALMRTPTLSPTRPGPSRRCSSSPASAA